MLEENKKLEKCKVCGNNVAKNAKVCPSCGAKKNKPFYKKWWFAVIVAIVIISAVSSSGKDEEKSQQTDQQPAVQQEAQQPSAPQPEEQKVTYIAYSVAELVNDLQENALKAKNKYENQYVEITGKLATIDSNGSYITLDPSNTDFNLTNVQCFLTDKEQEMQVMEMSNGDIVTLRGKINSVGEVLGYSLKIDSIVE